MTDIPDRDLRRFIEVVLLAVDAGRQTMAQPLRQRLRELVARPGPILVTDLDGYDLQELGRREATFLLWFPGHPVATKPEPEGLDNSRPGETTVNLEHEPPPKGLLGDIQATLKRLTQGRN
jgi:hypothetical protein